MQHTLSSQEHPQHPSTPALAPSPRPCCLPVLPHPARLLLTCRRCSCALAAHANPCAATSALSVLLATAVLRMPAAHSPACPLWFTVVGELQAAEYLFGRALMVDSRGLRQITGFLNGWVSDWAQKQAASMIRAEVNRRQRMAAPEEHLGVSQQVSPHPTHQ